MISLYLILDKTFEIAGLQRPVFCSNQNLVNGINTLNIDFNRILLALLHVDDVQVYYTKAKSIILYKKDFEYTLSEQEIGEFKLEPYAHQITAINFGIKHFKWLNLFSMGLG